MQLIRSPSYPAGGSTTTFELLPQSCVCIADNTAVAACSDELASSHQLHLMAPPPPQLTQSFLEMLILTAIKDAGAEGWVSCTRL